MREKGAAQAAAREAKEVIMSKNNEMLILRRVEEANQRHQLAVKRLRQEKLEAAAIKTKRKLDRERVIDKEKIRAATVAALPKPEKFKNPIEDVPKCNLPEVELRDETKHNKTSYYDHPTG